MLAVAIHADHVLEAKFKRQLVTRLHRAAQPEVMRQCQDMGAGRLRDGDVPSPDESSITRTGVPGSTRWTSGSTVRDRALLVEAGHQDQQSGSVPERGSMRGHLPGRDPVTRGVSM